jgi:hypothetical protein
VSEGPIRTDSYNGQFGNAITTGSTVFGLASLDGILGCLFKQDEAGAVADDIANGHAYDKHVIDRGE